MATKEKVNKKDKAVSKKQQREKLIHKLGEAEHELGYLEYTLIPKLIDDLKKLGLTKREIEENNLEDLINIYGS